MTVGGYHRGMKIARAAILVWIVLVLALLVGALTDDAKASPPRDHRTWSLARVTVVDETGGAWGDLVAVEDAWDASRFVRVNRADVCQPFTYCVTVRAYDAGQTDWMGQTSPVGTGGALVELNLFYGQDPALRSAIYCHEFGHALGIGHPGPETALGVPGCIAGTDQANQYPLPTPADQAALKGAAKVRGAGPWQGWGAVWWAYGRRG